jgi:hypothetical protein
MYKIILRGVYKEVKEVFTDSYKSQAALNELGLGYFN